MRYMDRKSHAKDSCSFASVTRKLPTNGVLGAYKEPPVG